MDINARDLWRSCWRAARVEFSALEQDCRFNGIQIPAGDRLQRCRIDHSLQQLAYHLIDVRTVNDLPGYQWITEGCYRFHYLRALAVRLPEDERIPF